jgi:hypothetical protein
MQVHFHSDTVVIDDHESTLSAAQTRLSPSIVGGCFDRAFVTLA